jgi:protein-tyrosine phosphatase
VAEVKRLLFVCLGNIVRSPLAENMFRKLAEEAGVGEKYDVDSAGTSAYHVGERPDRRMRQVASSKGWEYGGRSRRVERNDLYVFDMIIAMDPDNRYDLRRLARTSEQEEKIRLMREFDPQADGNMSVPDPYYGGMDGFEHTYQIIERSCKGLLEALETGQEEVGLN